MNVQSVDVQKIKDLIKDKYGSLESPCFDFVQEALNAQPYSVVIGEITQEFKVEEDTDPNEDVSFGYILTKEGSMWLLRISMLGPYAALFRLRSPQELEFIPSIPQERTEAENKLATALNRHEIQILDEAILSRQIPLTLQDIEKGETKLYHALFSDSGEVLWK